MICLLGLIIVFYLIKVFVASSSSGMLEWVYFIYRCVVIIVYKKMYVVGSKGWGLGVWCGMVCECGGWGLEGGEG